MPLEYENDVCETVLMSLSGQDVAYLRAMASVAANGRARSSDAARAMGVSTGYAQQYRARLLDAGVIAAPRHGVVEFAVPYVESHLPAQADSAQG